MADRTELVQIKVTPDEKQKFQEYVESTNEFDSLSRMFRVLAHRHIETDGQERDATVDTEEIVDAVDIAVADVVERLERVEDKVAELDSSIRTDDEIGQLTHEIVSNLPIYESDDQIPKPTEIDQGGVEDLEMAQQLSTVDAWADYFEISVDKARRALARAQEHPDVKYVEGARGYRRYYKTTEGR